MSPLEVAAGWVHGFDDRHRPCEPGVGPRLALERILRASLVRPPCVVAFSGGRDSSVLLATAVTLARREGLPAPVSLTLTYPSLPETDERQWQHQVLDHLRIAERVEVAVDDEHDLLGPVAAPLLRRHGNVWPPNLAPTWRLMSHARGGSLVTGECGDEVFGLKRITPLRRIIEAHGRVGRSLYPCAALGLAPAVVRRRTLSHPSRRYQRRWLRPAMKALLERCDVADEVSLSLHAGHSAWQLIHRRAIRRAMDTHRALGQEIGVDYVAPFSQASFVAAVARDAGFWGLPGRGATMTHLFGDLLPRPVLRRTSKATFGRAVFHRHARDFASRWDGRGVDTELVDVEALRDIWLSEHPDGGTMALMQQAWLASQKAGKAVT